MIPRNDHEKEAGGGSWDLLETLIANLSICLLSISSVCLSDRLSFLDCLPSHIACPLPVWVFGSTQASGVGARGKPTWGGRVPRLGSGTRRQAR